jgi:hypothetical protein
MNKVVAWYIDCEDPDNGMPYRSVTFNADDVTSLHVPLYAIPDTHCVVPREITSAIVVDICARLELAQRV